MKALRDQAIEEGDHESAAIFEGRIQKLNNITGQEVVPLAKPQTKDAPASTAAPAYITTKDEFDALKSGDRFILNGKVGVKK